MDRHELERLKAEQPDHKHAFEMKEGGANLCRRREVLVHTENVCFCHRKEGRKPNGPKRFYIADKENNILIPWTPWPGEGDRLEKLLAKLLGPIYQVCRDDGMHSYLVELQELEGENK